MRSLYTFGIRCYALGIRIASLWNLKAKKWIRGRKDVWSQIQQFEREKDTPLYWFHCASLGEFEQGRPIIEALKLNEDCQVVVTFFSPSGYEIRKDYKKADLVTYLPVDTKGNAQKFLEKVQPTRAYFIKYEFWVNFILESKSLGVELVLVAALFRKDQIFFKRRGELMRAALNAYDKVFVQNEASQKLLNSIKVSSVIAGDTRYDRVMENAKRVTRYEEIETFLGNQPVLVCGSVWKEGFMTLLPTINANKDWKVIVAPHEIHDAQLALFESKCEHGTIRYSSINDGAGFEDTQVLFIDNIGMLMNLYQYGNLAYIGGAFGTGLHNILEPAAFGLPVIFGPEYKKFPEAFLFLSKGIGFSISNSEEFQQQFDALKSHTKKDEILAFMTGMCGATEKILG